MTSVRSLFFLLLIAILIGGFATPVLAADDKAQTQSSAASLQNQNTDAALFGQRAENMSASSDLFFLKTRPRLNLSPPTVPPKFTILNDDCYTMRMYKVKRKEHFADGESGSRGYSTCELASNYQIRTAIVHVKTLEDNQSRSDTPQK